MIDSYTRRNYFTSILHACEQRWLWRDREKSTVSPEPSLVESGIKVSTYSKSHELTPNMVNKSFRNMSVNGGKRGDIAKFHKVIPMHERVGSFMFLFCLVFAMSLCASVYMCFVVTCWERADLLALVCGVYCEFVTFPLVSWVRCGT